MFNENNGEIVTKIKTFLYKYKFLVFEMIYVKFHYNAKINYFINNQKLSIYLFIYL
jgi:hypothetical protein